MGTLKQTREEAEKDAFAFLGYGCALTSIQTFAVFFVLLLTDFDWFTKWLFIFPIIAYVLSVITFTIKIIQIELRF